MKRILLPVVLCLICISSFSQRLHFGVFGGLAAYQGDLTDKIFPKKTTNGAIGVSLNYELTDHWMLRGGFTYAIVGGADRFSDKPDLVARNLSFETKIVEFSLMGEYYVFNLHERRYSPYIFGGFAPFHFNPYAFNGSANKIFLKPLSTEGEGIAGYAAKPYSLTQMAIPFGGGLKFAVTDNIHIGIELGMRMLFTDYLDDVSSNYADAGDLLAARGQLAVDMAYRGDEVPTGSPVYPNKGDQRGSPKVNDFYYFTGIHLTYRLGNGNGRVAGRRNRTGCPANPM